MRFLILSLHDVSTATWLQLYVYKAVVTLLWKHRYQMLQLKTLFYLLSFIDGYSTKYIVYNWDSEVIVPTTSRELAQFNFVNSMISTHDSCYYSGNIPIATIKARL